MKHGSRIGALLALAGAVAACGEVRSDPPRAGTGAHDAAIVESSAPVWRDGNEWTISPEPLVRIGRADGEPGYQLYGISGVVRLGDGRIVVADGGARMLRFYGTDGRHLASAGGRGEGPGEFRSMDALSKFAGDSLLVWDRGAARASIFDPAGRYIRSVRPAGLSLLPSFAGALPDGSFVVSAGVDPSRMGAPSGTERRDTLTFLRFDRTGSFGDTVGRFAGPERYLDFSQGTMTAEAVIFGRNTALAVGRDRIFAAENAGYDIAELDVHGTLVRRIRRRTEPRRATRADVELFRGFLLDRQLAGVPPEVRDGAARRVSSIPHRATLPVLDEIRIDADGYLWVEEYRVPGTGPGRWDVFGPDGRWLGAVRMPAGLHVAEIGRDYLIGVGRDDLDVEQVHLFRLDRGG